jgi:hypothetical protein
MPSPMVEQTVTHFTGSVNINTSEFLSKISELLTSILGTMSANRLSRYKSMRINWCVSGNMHNSEISVPWGLQ